MIDIQSGSTQYGSFFDKVASIVSYKTFQSRIYSVAVQTLTDKKQGRVKASITLCFFYSYTHMS
jgi:hypothetical protein